MFVCGGHSAGNRRAATEEEEEEEEEIGSQVVSGPAGMFDYKTEGGKN